jgi:chromosome segregation ATPase
MNTWLVTLLAQSGVPFPPQNILMNFVWGAIGVLMIAALALVVWNQGKAAFGRTPPLDQVLAGLATVERDVAPLMKKLEDVLQKLDTKVDRKEMEASAADRADIRKELNNRLKAHEQVFSDFRHSYASKDELNAVSLRAETYRQEVLAVRDSTNKLQERTDNHIRKFDSLEQKLDRLIERLSKNV